MLSRTVLIVVSDGTNDPRNEAQSAK